MPAALAGLFAHNASSVFAMRERRRGVRSIDGGSCRVGSWGWPPRGQGPAQRRFKGRDAAGSQTARGQGPPPARLACAPWRPGLSPRPQALTPGGQVPSPITRGSLKAIMLPSWHPHPAKFPASPAATPPLTPTPPAEPASP